MKKMKGEGSKEAGGGNDRGMFIVLVNDRAVYRTNDIALALAYRLGLGKGEVFNLSSPDPSIAAVVVV